MRDMLEVYDNVYSLHTKRNCWFSHASIHPDELRGKLLNIHGHVHQHTLDDPNYFNACVENTDFKPITFEEIMERTQC